MLVRIHEIFNTQSKNNDIAQVGRDAREVYLTALQIENITGHKLKTQSDRLKIVRNMQSLKVIDRIDGYTEVIALTTNIFVLGVVMLMFNEALAVAINQKSMLIVVSSFLFVMLGKRFMMKAIKSAINKQINTITKEVAVMSKEWHHISKRVDIDWWA